MATQTQDPAEPSATALVGGIIDDMHDLLKQQVELTRKEMTEEIRKGSEAVQLYALGGAVLFLGIFVLGLAIVHLLHWASAPLGNDPATIPLWICHAIVGGPLTLVGAFLTWMGREKLCSINPLHNPATEALKDNVRWTTNSK